jgi:hypothetical protein
MPDKYLTPKELEERWRGQVNVRTLANWRSGNQGPRFVKIGGRVLYRIEDIEAYEAKRMRGAV